MPLTPFQKEVLLLLAAHRNAERYVGGGAVLHRPDASPRYSQDIDLFHDVAGDVAASATADASVLIAAGCAVEWLSQQPSLYRARVSRADDGLRLDWCHDSSFRFFPVQPDPDFGYCLHPADLATNKVLALAGRTEIRDYLDTLYLHQTYLSLGAMCWAACGKDQGFTPWSLLEMLKRHVRFRQEELDAEQLVQPLQLPTLKEFWLAAVQQAEEWFDRLPAAEVGCLYLDQHGQPCTPDPIAEDFAGMRRHFGSIRGTWPVLA